MRLLRFTRVEGSYGIDVQFVSELALLYSVVASILLPASRREGY